LAVATVVFDDGVAYDDDYVNPFYGLCELFYWNVHYHYVHRQRQDSNGYLWTRG